jgi:hypothetical protein
VRASGWPANPAHSTTWCNGELPDRANDRASEAFESVGLVGSGAAAFGSNSACHILRLLRRNQIGFVLVHRHLT